jgi:hypothetical protein
LASMYEAQHPYIMLTYVRTLVGTNYGELTSLNGTGTAQIHGET